MTALHWAAANGMMTVIDDLLRRGVPLEVENAWERDRCSTRRCTSRCTSRSKGVDYVPVLERVLQAGANVDVVDYPTGKPLIDELLARYGAGKR